MASAEMTKLYAKKLVVWKQLLNYADFMRGSLVTLKRPCIYKDKCKKCRSGEKHPTVYYSISRKNKTTLIYLPKEIQPNVKKMINNYRKIMGVIDQISEIVIAIIKLQIKERNQR